MARYPKFPEELKRTQLERILRSIGAQPEKEGSRHSTWTRIEFGATHIASIPRHTTISKRELISICRQFGIKNKEFCCLLVGEIPARLKPRGDVASSQ